MKPDQYTMDEKLLEEIQKLRRDLHRHPELSGQEYKTAKTVANQLRHSNLDEVNEGIAGTGVVGVLKGAHPGPTVALRADMDALPIGEKTNLDYASIHDGAMHACGHDGHMAVLLGAAKLLASHRDLLHGSVKFIFQPAEEVGNGAQRMLDAGVLTSNPRVDCIFALHARPQIEVGKIQLDPIPAAATQSFEIRVIGHSAHGAYPHQGVDSVVIASQLVTALQQLVSRQVAPFQPVVVTVGSFHAGTAANIIAPEAVLKGTIRTRDAQVQKKVLEAMQKISRGITESLGGNCEVVFTEGSPRVKNDSELMELIRSVGVHILGPENVLGVDEPTMGGEDFGFYLAEQGGVPGCLFRLGVETDEPLHSPGFDFGDRAVEIGIKMLTHIVYRVCSKGKKT